MSKYDTVCTIYYHTSHYTHLGNILVYYIRLHSYFCTSDKHWQNSMKPVRLGSLRVIRLLNMQDYAYILCTATVEHDDLVTGYVVNTDQS